MRVVTLGQSLTTYFWFERRTWLSALSERRAARHPKRLRTRTGAATAGVVNSGRGATEQDPSKSSTQPGIGALGRSGGGGARDDRLLSGP